MSKHAEIPSAFVELFAFIRAQYPDMAEIPLHVPCLGDIEKQYLNACIDSSFVSSVGTGITTFENAIAEHAGAKYAVALVNGTAALQLALVVANVRPGTEVITQSLTFIGTANAIAHCGAEPVFVDIDASTLGMCPDSLRSWLQENTQTSDGKTTNRHTGRIVAACICMHSFGHPARIRELQAVCEEFQIPLIEDAAEAFGSRYYNTPVGAQSYCGIYSFNGNKIITTGGGGALVTNDQAVAEKARHLATTAKLAHPWQSIHDEVGYNFRMPNLNASLGLAQLQRFDGMLQTKRTLAEAYQQYFAGSEFQWVAEPENCESNCWLNSILCRDRAERDALLQAAQDQNIHMRAVWEPLADSKVYGHCQRGDLSTTAAYAPRLINLPSAVVGSIHAKS